jgi:MFS family permease
MLFLLEGIPSIVLGLCIPLLLPNGIRSAGWLTQAEKEFLEEPLKREEARKEKLPLAQVFVDRRLLLFSMVYFCCAMGLYGTGFWIPQLIKNTGVKDLLNVGLLAAIPYGCGAIAMVLFGRSSDRSGERRVHFAIASLLGAAGIVVSNLFREKHTGGNDRLEHCHCRNSCDIPSFLADADCVAERNRRGCRNCMDQFTRQPCWFFWSIHRGMDYGLDKTE